MPAATSLLLSGMAAFSPLPPSLLPLSQVSGSAASSSSHRHGSFHDACSYLTVILGNGSVVTCSKKDDAELFHSMAGSQGTLGLVALVGVECEEAGELKNREGGREGGREGKR